MKVIEVIEKLVQDELDRANSIHGPFTSQHQGHGVIKEEFEETMENLAGIENALSWLWRSIRENNNMCQHQICETIYRLAVASIEELTQVAAMALKYQALLKPDISPDAEEDRHL